MPKKRTQKPRNVVRFPMIRIAFDIPTSAYDALAAEAAKIGKTPEAVLREGIQLAMAKAGRRTP